MITPLAISSFPAVSTCSKDACNILDSNLVHAKKYGVPKCSRKLEAEKEADTELRRALESELFGPLKKDPKPPPPGWFADYTHLQHCTSCFQEEHMRSVHTQELSDNRIAAPGRYEVVGLDDHAIELWKNVSRVMEAPKKHVTDLSCPGPRCLGGDPEHGKKNHFGMYGSVIYEKGRFRIWLGEWVPYYSTSADGIRWDPLRPLQAWKGFNASKENELDSSSLVPRNLCVTRTGPPSERNVSGQATEVLHKYKLGFHCGNYTGWESTCIAHSSDGLEWTPYHQKQNCGPACKWAADTTNCLFWYPGDFTGGDETSALASKAGYRLINRRNYGTPAAWREIRGIRVSVATGNGGLLSGDDKDAAELAHFEELSSWYFDRLGKAERFQRQMYSLSVASDLFETTGLNIGIATVIE